MSWVKKELSTVKFPWPGTSCFYLAMLSQPQWLGQQHKLVNKSNLEIVMTLHVFGTDWFLGAHNC